MLSRTHGTAHFGGVFSLTQQEANMSAKTKVPQPEAEVPPLGTIIVSILAGLLFLSPLIALIWFSGRSNCVEMPNGFLIGRATVFSSMIHTEEGLPDIAIRYPDGQLFARGDINIDFWDKEGIGGTFMRFNDGTNIRHPGNFVFLNEIGLIEQKEQPEMYATYFEMKNKEWERLGRYRANLYHVYDRLMQNPANQRNWCKTDWFLPDE